MQSQWIRMNDKSGSKMNRVDREFLALSQMYCLFSQSTKQHKHKCQKSKGWHDSRVWKGPLTSRCHVYFSEAYYMIAIHQDQLQELNKFDNYGRWRSCKRHGFSSANPKISGMSPVIGCTAVGFRRKTIEINNS